MRRKRLGFKGTEHVKRDKFGRCICRYVSPKNTYPPDHHANQNVARRSPTPEHRLTADSPGDRATA